MKIIKILLLILWVASTATFLLGLLTPLEFTNKYILFASFLISFNGAFNLAYLLTSFISLKWNNFILGLITSVAILFSAYYFPGLNLQWQSSRILFQDRNDSTVVIINQQIESKDGMIQQRNIKVIPATPLFNWVSEMKTLVNLDETRWKRIEESELTEE